MKIVFIADMHDKSYPDGVKIDFKARVNDNLMPMLRLLDDRYRNDKISLLVFLGDYSEGKASKEDKQAVLGQVLEFVKQIEDKSQIFDKSDGIDIKDRIVFIDGNHDVVRGEGHHDVFESKFSEYLTPYTQIYGDKCKKYGAPVFDFNELDMLLACISTTQNAGAHYANIDNLIPLIKPLESTDPDKYGTAINIINKAIDADIGSVTSETIERFKKFSETERKTKIVVSHHPLIPMQRATAVHFDTINGVIFFETARAKGYSFFVHGHLHEFNCVEIASKGNYSDLPTATLIGVPAFISNEGQQFVELEINGNDYMCRHLRVNKIRDKIEEVELAENTRNIITPKNDHILLDYEIRKLIEEGKVVKNASSEHIETISYDCSLGLSYKRFDREKNAWPEEVMSPAESGPAKISLKPGETVLLYTQEEFDIPNDMMLHASPRASLNRKGIGVDLSYFVDPGFVGPFCFPVTNKNNYPIDISSQEAIMSVMFHQLSGNVDHGWKDKHPQSKDRRTDKRDT